MKRMLIITLTLAILAPFSHAAEQRYNQVHLQTSATTPVENDTLSSVLTAQRQGNHAPTLARQVNQRIRWAITEAKKIAGVSVRTLDYRTQPLYRKNKLDGWRVSQSIELKSRDAAELSGLIGRLQEKLALQSINYGVSAEKREQAEQALIGTALDKFSQRARQIANDLGFKGFKLVQINVNTRGARPPQPRMMRAMAMESADASPAIEAGKQQMTVTVSGSVELTQGNL